MSDYTVKRLDEMERAFGGIWVRARASLGASAFGFQITDFPAGAPDFYPKHTHDHDGQEEVYLVLDGDGQMSVDGETLPLDRDTWVRVGPSVARHVKAGAGGLRLLVIGGVPGGVYRAPAPTELGGPEEMGEGIVE